MRTSRRSWFAVYCSAAFSHAACGGGDDIIVKTSEGVGLTAVDIDKNPLALLPAGAAGVLNLEPQALFRSSTGAQLKRLLEARLPLPASAGFLPERDLRRLIVGFYSFQGVDFAGVAVGEFDPVAIAAAADQSQNTQLGAPLVRVEYAGRTFYVSANIGFAVLTTHTAVFGNETGIRRALDRLEAGRVAVEVSPEIESLLERPGAPMAFGSDAGQAPHVTAVTSSIPALRDLKMARVVGDFEPPGVNFAGTLTYPSVDSAESARQAILKVHQDITSVTWLVQAVGLGQPIQHLEVRTKGASVQFTIGLNGTATNALLQQFAAVLGVQL